MTFGGFFWVGTYIYIFIYIYIYIYILYIYKIYCVYIYIILCIYIYTVYIYIHCIYIYCIYILYIYTGWWFQPRWKILVSWHDYSQYMEKNVSSHQSVYKVYIYIYSGGILSFYIALALLDTSGVLDLSLHGVHLFPTTPATTGPMWIPIFTSTETGMDRQGSSSMGCTKGMW